MAWWKLFKQFAWETNQINFRFLEEYIHESNRNKIS